MDAKDQHELIVSELHHAADRIGEATVPGLVPELDRLVAASADFLRSSNLSDEGRERRTGRRPSIGYGIVLGWLAREKIGSPSRVMRDQIGKMIVARLARPIDRRT